MTTGLLRLILLLGVFALGAAPALHGQEVGEAVEAAAGLAESALEAAQPADDVGTDEAEGGGLRFSTAIEIALLLTVLSLIPAALITVTSFTRIVIVLSFVRRSLGVNELPPNPVMIGLALFLTSFVMAPVASRVYERAYVPYEAEELEGEAAVQTAWGELRMFLLANTREGELRLFADLARVEPKDDGTELTAADLPFQVVVPAFILSELKTAFQMGFLLFLPFLLIDLVVASVLISMGMFMLPPVMISTPFKILLFVLVDGWHLVCESLVTSFLVT
ncbi:MAG: flagellar type III secretion system pore protein FliP [Planctomycetota bacterium]